MNTTLGRAGLSSATQRPDSASNSRDATQRDMAGPPTRAGGRSGSYGSGRAQTADLLPRPAFVPLTGNGLIPTFSPFSTQTDAMSFFPDVQKIRYDGPTSTDPLA